MAACAVGCRLAACMTESQIHRRLYENTVIADIPFLSLDVDVVVLVLPVDVKK